MPTHSATTAPPPGDAGLSLLEVLTALFVISTVMAGAAPFLVTSVAMSSRQRTDQVAIQVANDGLERARAIRPRELPEGRGEAAAEEQWKAAPAEVETLLEHMERVWDEDLPGSLEGEQAPLPTTSVPVEINKTTYEVDFYVGRCWQSKAVASGSGGTPTESNCDKAVSGVPFYRVVVGVRWKHAACADKCVYTASTLISDAEDPVFDTVQPPPKVIDEPNTLVVYVDTDPQYRPEYQVKSQGGRLPLTWSYTGTLPPGLAMDPDSGLVSGKPTAKGSVNYDVVIKVTDKDGRSDDALFKWLVVDDLVLTAPTDQSTRNDTAVDLPVTAAGGRTPLKWTATELPPGLAIDPSTGRITGRTATTGAQTYYPTITVTDSGAPRTRSAKFAWYVGPLTTPLTLADYTPAPATKGTFVSYDLGKENLASGGEPGYTWSATDLPEDMFIDASTGIIYGTIKYASQYVATVTVTDKVGQRASIYVTFEVSAGGSDMRVIAPSGDPVVTRAGVSMTPIDADALGPQKAFWTWSARGLPPGVSITKGGRLSGTPTKPGTYRVTLTVNNKKDLAHLVFLWTVT
ncbi:putative Ig domain-containing protein [Couchioplanes azureus]|uniref:putative Ig domain-containing protein n=1 Tax=Couchioplanes caeruleus TaxID=56438 RepID=UPI00166FC6E2|nr:putative Ig domain-containing protein [Couchioplanes caeruleus]GGQ64563.1 hypothetical protein GCM10010166_37690 [Couchioplanes caeruleus subsp. azureus]